MGASQMRKVIWDTKLKISFLFYFFYKWWLTWSVSFKCGFSLLKLSCNVWVLLCSVEMIQWSCAFQDWECHPFLVDRWGFFFFFCVCLLFPPFIDLISWPSGEESPVPLSELPASCGFALKRVRRDVSLVAPYRGCHVRQQVSDDNGDKSSVMLQPCDTLHEFVWLISHLLTG